MNNLPAVSREHGLSVMTPVIPLNFVYPGLSLTQILSIVMAYRKLSMLIMFVVLSITVVTIMMWPRTYTATVTLMVNYEVNDPLNGKELPIGQLGSYIATQIELMQTQEVLLAVVEHLKLTEKKDYASGFAQGTGTLREWVAKKLSKNLAIYQGQMGSQLIYVSYSANQPEEAAQVANTVAEIYKEQDYMRSTGPPGDRAKRYAEQLNELKKKVDQAQVQLTAFRQRNSLIDDGNVDVLLLESLDARLLEVQITRNAAEARAAGDQSVNEEVLSSSFVQTLKAQLAEQSARLARLNRSYTAQHPDVMDLKSQIESTRRSLASALHSYTANASESVRVAQRLERNLQSALSAQRDKVLAKGQLHDEAAKYLLELGSAQAVYKRALDGYDQIMFASLGHYTNISFVSYATSPLKASKPRVLTWLMLGCIGAAVLGLGVPLGIELFNRRVRCRDDIERQHGIPVLAEFPARPLRMAV